MSAAASARAPTIKVDTKDAVQKKYDWSIDVVDVIGGKWKPLIMYVLNGDTLRFSELLDKVKPRISQRMLTKQLRQLEKDGMIARKVYAQVPPKVEYSITETGKSLMPILDDLCILGCEKMRDQVQYPCV